MLSQEQLAQFQAQIPFVFDFGIKGDPTGKLSFWQKNEIFPEGIQRCFWVYDVDEDETRGNHAHRSEGQVIVAIKGKISLKITDTAGNTKAFTLENPYEGFYLPPKYWIQTKFESGAVLLGMCNEPFEDGDYIRDFEEFLAMGR
ncbi:sugar 3,4-ketoisomerase [Algoriphagus sediminis]|uniref:FdtA/QdtA family cupin domain-containing protein n=1 Tax=Algoriphagus sediminis TaxID=3057113 RepID=A0ABT7Y8K6_9BACT|nr:FdtA/QdtA family cupin domain-containing protein [Algoriphagus sediminis]MDN3202852.1 FdtA/QdtA family cupin domain-containing protein [Algoriphagus sediminis]